MELGFIGLGRMGGNMVTRLARGGHRVVAWDPSADAARRILGAMADKLVKRFQQEATEEAEGES